MIIYNAHTHIFTSNYVPDYVVGQDKIPVIGKFLKMSKVARINHRILDIIHQASRPFEHTHRLVTFAKIGLGATQEDILNRLEEYYKGWGDLRIVVLTMDMESMGAGMVESNFWTQLDELILLRAKGRYKDTLLPFYCVDPRRPEYINGNALLDRVTPYFEKYGFTGIKLYPALGYYPDDEKLFPLYEWCQQNNIPLMTHCIEGVIYYRGNLKALRPHPDPQFNYDNNSDKNIEYQRNFTQPSNFKRVLQKFPELKICFGHYGGVDEMLKRGGWTDQIRKLMEEYPNVYADTSFIIEDQRSFEVLLKDMCSVAFGKRILFGTDYFVVSKNKLEDQLAGDFREFMNSRKALPLFFRAAKENVDEYLKSVYYEI